MKICVVHRYPLMDILSTNPSFQILLEEICAEGHRVHIVNYRKKIDQGDEKIFSLGSLISSPIGLTYDRSERLDRILKSLLFIFIAPLRVLVEHLREHFDVIYCDDALPVYYFFIKKLTKSKVVYRMGDLMLGYLFDENSRIKSLFLKLALIVETRMLNTLDSVLAISDVMKEFLLMRGVQSDRITVVPECIDSKMFNPVVSGDNIRYKYKISSPLIMFHGVLVPWKGIEKLLLAMPSVLNKYPQAKLMIVGDGPSLIHLKELTNELKINGNVIFTGWIPFKSIPEYIAACDIGVPLRNKGPANEMIATTALLQYTAIGRPIVAPNMKTIAQFIERTGNGLLFKPDDPQDLADKLIYSITHLDEMMKMTNQQASFVKQTYDVNIVATQLRKNIMD